MDAQYSTIKQNRRLQRFSRFVGLYFLLWFIFRYAIEIFRGNFNVPFGNIIFTGVIFSIIIGLFSLYKKQVLYLDKKDKEEILQWLTTNNFEMTKQLNITTLLYIQPKINRLERHQQIIIRDFETYLEIECDIKQQEELSKILPVK